MTQKYKLAPIESTIEMRQAADMTGDVWDVYTNMLAQCETVEVVDFSTVLSNYLKDNVSTIRTPPVSPPTTIEFKEYLTQNGYKIVKVV